MTVIGGFGAKLSCKNKSGSERLKKSDNGKKDKQSSRSSRVEYLLAQADALHRAERIRGYVAAVHEANKSAPKPMSADELKSWAAWALTQADRLDPVFSGRRVQKLK